MASPYRHHEAEKPKEPKSGELVYRPQERQDRISGGRHGFKLFLVPSVAGLIVGKVVTEWAGVLVFAALLGLIVWWSRKRPENVLVLRVTKGELAVIPMGTASAVFCVRLDALDDVTLETKTVERHMETAAGAVNIGMGPLAPSIAAATDTNRITLEAADGATHALTKDYFGHAESVEQFAKVRSFLRSMGWTPLSERGEEEDDDDDDESEDEDVSVRAAS